VVDGAGERGADDVGLHRAEAAPVEEVDDATVCAATPHDMRVLGRRVARLLRAGDLVVLTGDLGAGKTTFAQGLGEGLGVRGPVTSPTFVIARVHPSTVGGPPLVHVDAYRLGGLDEVDDLDLDATLADSVTVVEWGEGLVEDLATDRLEVRLRRPRGDDDAEEVGATEELVEPRTLHLTGVGTRWKGVALPGSC
jgi:tRNA threonylcarbamoyladenosine biosynthesis protein TsaE